MRAVLQRVTEATVRVDGEVIGDIRVHDGAVYTVIWGNSEKDVRLVKINLQNTTETEFGYEGNEKIHG